MNHISKYTTEIIGVNEVSLLSLLRVRQIEMELLALSTSATLQVTLDCIVSDPPLVLLPCLLAA